MKWPRSPSVVGVALVLVYLFLDFQLTFSTKNNFNNEITNDGMDKNNSSLSLMRNEARRLLEEELEEIKESLLARLQKFRPRRSQRSLPSRTGTRSYTTKGLSNVNLTSIVKILDLPNVYIEEVVVIKKQNYYVLVAGRPFSVGQTSVSLPVITLDGDLKVSNVVMTTVPAATGVEGFVIDNALYFLYTVNTGVDFVDPTIERNILYKIDSDDRITSVQTFLTVSASKWHSFVSNGRTYLAQASYLKYTEPLRTYSECDVTKLKASRSIKIYEWVNKGFKKVTTIKGSYVTDIDDCTINNRHFVIVANRQMIVNHSESFIFVYEVFGKRKESGFQLKLFQKLPASAPRNVICFKTNEELFLAVANEFRIKHGRRYYDTESVIYRFNGLFFAKYQQIGYFGGFDWDLIRLPGSYPVTMLRLKTRTSDNPLFVYIKTNGWISFELPSLYGIQHVRLLEDDHVASVGTNLVLLKWMRTEDSFLKTSLTCRDLYNQLQRIQLLRLDFETQFRLIVEDLRMKNRSVKMSVQVPQKRSWMMLDQKVKKLKIEATNAERSIDLIVAKHQKDLIDGHLILEGLKTDLLVATQSMSAATLFGVNFNDFVKNAVKLIPFAENVWSTDGKFFHLNLRGPVYLKGSLNHGMFPGEYAILSRENMFTTPHLNSVVMIDSMNINSGILDGVDVAKIMVTYGDQKILGGIVFHKELTVNNLTVASSRIGNIDWNFLISKAVRLDQSSTVFGTVEFVSGIDIRRRLYLGGKIVDVDVVSWSRNSLMVTGRQIVNAKLTWSNVTFLKDLSTPLVNVDRFPEDYILLSDKLWHFELALPALNALTLVISGKINGLDLAKDVVTTHGRQEIWGKKIFDAVTMKNVNFLKNRDSVQRMSRLSVNKFIVLGRLYPNLQKLIHNSASQATDIIGCRRVVFEKDVKFSSDLNLPSTQFKHLVPLRSLDGYRLAEVSLSNIDLLAPVSVKGSVNRIKLEELYQKTLLTSKDQNVQIMLKFTDALESAPNINFFNIRGKDFVWKNDRLRSATLKSDIEVLLKALHVKYLNVDGYLNGINISSFFIDTVRQGLPQIIKGSKIFQNGLQMTSGRVEVKKMFIGGKDFMYLARNVVTSGKDKILHGVVEFTAPLHINSLHTGFIDDIHMGRFYKQSLQKDEMRSVILQGSVHARNVTVKQINGLDLKSFFSNAVWTDYFILPMGAYFEKLQIGKLDLSGTINGLRIEDFVHKALKTISFSAPKTIKGHVIVSQNIDLLGGMHSSSSLKSHDHLIISGDILTKGFIDGVDWNEFTKSAVWIFPNKKSKISGHYNFEALYLDKTPHLFGQLSGFNLIKLCKEMVTVDAPQVINGQLTFEDVYIHGQLTTNVLDITNKCPFNGHDLNYQRNFTGNRTSIDRFVFVGTVTVLGNLNVKEAVDVSTIYKVDDKRTFQFLEVENLEINGLLMGVNITDWSAKTIHLNGSTSRLSGRKVFKDAMFLGRVVCTNPGSASERIGTERLQIYLSSTTPLHRNTAVSGIEAMEHKGIHESTTCSDIYRFKHFLNGMVMFDNFVLKETLTDHLFCILHETYSMETIFVTVKCRDSKYYVVTHTESKTEEFKLPDRIYGTFKKCHSFYDGKNLLVVLGMHGTTSNTIVLFADTTAIQTYNGALHDVESSNGTLLMITLSSFTGSLTAKILTIWKWEKSIHSFKQIQTITQPYRYVDAKFMQSASQLVVSTFHKSSLITVYENEKLEFNQRAIIDASGFKISVCRHGTIAILVSDKGVLEVLDLRGAKLERKKLHFPFIERAYCLQFGKNSFVVSQSGSLTIYNYPGFLQLGQISSPSIANIYGIRKEQDYLFIQQTLDKNCKFGQIQIYHVTNIEKLKFCLEICDDGRFGAFRKSKQCKKRKWTECPILEGFAEEQETLEVSEPDYTSSTMLGIGEDVKLPSTDALVDTGKEELTFSTKYLFKEVTYPTARPEETMKPVTTADHRETFEPTEELGDVIDKIPITTDQSTVPVYADSEELHIVSTDHFDVVQKAFYDSTVPLDDKGIVTVPTTEIVIHKAKDLPAVSTEYKVVNEMEIPRQSIEAITDSTDLIRKLIGTSTSPMHPELEIDRMADEATDLIKEIDVVMPSTEKEEKELTSFTTDVTRQTMIEETASLLTTDAKIDELIPMSTELVREYHKRFLEVSTISIVDEESDFSEKSADFTSQTTVEYTIDTEPTGYVKETAVHKPISSTESVRGGKEITDSISAVPTISDTRQTVTSTLVKDEVEMLISTEDILDGVQMEFAYTSTDKAEAKFKVDSIEPTGYVKEILKIAHSTDEVERTTGHEITPVPTDELLHAADIEMKLDSTEHHSSNRMETAYLTTDVALHKVFEVHTERTVDIAESSDVVRLVSSTEESGEEFSLPIEESTESDEQVMRHIGQDLLSTEHVPDEILVEILWPSTEKTVEEKIEEFTVGSSTLGGRSKIPTAQISVEPTAFEKKVVNLISSTEKLRKEESVPVYGSTIDFVVKATGLESPSTEPVVRVDTKTLLSSTEYFPKDVAESLQHSTDAALVETHELDAKTTDVVAKLREHKDFTESPTGDTKEIEMLGVAATTEKGEELVVSTGSTVPEVVDDIVGVTETVTQDDKALFAIFTQNAPQLIKERLIQLSTDATVQDEKMTELLTTDSVIDEKEMKTVHPSTEHFQTAKYSGQVDVTSTEIAKEIMDGKTPSTEKADEGLLPFVSTEPSFTVKRIDVEETTTVTLTPVEEADVTHISTEDIVDSVKMKFILSSSTDIIEKEEAATGDGVVEPTGHAEEIDVFAQSTHAVEREMLVDVSIASQADTITITGATVTEASTESELPEKRPKMLHPLTDLPRIQVSDYKEDLDSTEYMDETEDELTLSTEEEETEDDLLPHYASTVSTLDKKMLALLSTDVTIHLVKEPSLVSTEQFADEEEVDLMHHSTAVPVDEADVTVATPSRLATEVDLTGAKLEYSEKAMDVISSTEVTGKTKFQLPVISSTLSGVLEDETVPPFTTVADMDKMKEFSFIASTESVRDEDELRVAQSSTDLVPKDITDYAVIESTEQGVEESIAKTQLSTEKEETEDDLLPQHASTVSTLDEKMLAPQSTDVTMHLDKEPSLVSTEHFADKEWDVRLVHHSTGAPVDKADLTVAYSSSDKYTTLEPKLVTEDVNTQKYAEKIIADVAMPSTEKDLVIDKLTFLAVSTDNSVLDELEFGMTLSSTDVPKDMDPHLISESTEHSVEADEIVRAHPSTRVTDIEIPIVPAYGSTIPAVERGASMPPASTEGKIYPDKEERLSMLTELYATEKMDFIYPSTGTDETKTDVVASESSSKVHLLVPLQHVSTVSAAGVVWQRLDETVIHSTPASTKADLVQSTEINPSEMQLATHFPPSCKLKETTGVDSEKKLELVCETVTVDVVDVPQLEADEKDNITDCDDGKTEDFSVTATNLPEVAEHEEADSTTIMTTLEDVTESVEDFTTMQTTTDEYEGNVCI